MRRTALMATMLVAVLGFVADSSGGALAQDRGSWNVASSQPDLVVGRVSVSGSGAATLAIDSLGGLTQSVKVATVRNARLTPPSAPSLLVAKGGMQWEAFVIDPSVPATVEMTAARDAESIAFDLAVLTLKAVVSQVPGGDCITRAIAPEAVLGLAGGVPLGEGFLLMAEALIRKDFAAAGQHADAAVRQTITYLESRAGNLFVTCGLDGAGAVAEAIALAFPATAPLVVAVKVAKIVYMIAPLMIAYVDTMWSYGTDAAKLSFSYAPAAIVRSTPNPPTPVPPTRIPSTPIPPTPVPPTRIPPTPIPPTPAPPTQIPPTPIVSPAISSLGCPNSADVGQLVTCSPTVSGPVTTWNWVATGSASPNSGTGRAYSTRFQAAGQQSINLTACNQNQCKQATANLTVRPLIQAPNPPTTASIRALGPNSLAVEWLHDGKDVDGFRVEDGTGTYYAGRFDRSVTISGLQPGAYRCATVVAFNAAGEAGRAAGCATTSTPPALAPPSAPTDVDAGPDGFVRWDDTADESGYRIYLGGTDCGGGAFGPLYDVATVGADTTTFDARGISFPAIYCNTRWGVSAFNDAGESAITWDYVPE